MYLHLVFSITVTCSLQTPVRTIGTVIEDCFIITSCLPVALYFFFSLSRFHAPNPPGPAGEPRYVRPDSALLTYRILCTPPTNTCKEVSHSTFTSRSTNHNLNTLNCKTQNPCSLNALKPELNPICYLLALLGAHHFLHVSRIRVKLLTFRLLMSYVYGAPILDVSRSHTTTQHRR